MRSYYSCHEVNDTCTKCCTLFLSWRLTWSQTLNSSWSTICLWCQKQLEGQGHFNVIIVTMIDMDNRTTKYYATGIVMVTKNNHLNIAENMCMWCTSPYQPFWGYVDARIGMTKWFSIKLSLISCWLICLYCEMYPFSLNV